MLGATQRTPNLNNLPEGCIILKEEDVKKQLILAVGRGARVGFIIGLVIGSITTFLIM